LGSECDDEVIARGSGIVSFNKNIAEPDASEVCSEISCSSNGNKGGKGADNVGG